METPQNELHAEREREPEQEERYAGKGNLEPHEGSLSAEEVTAELDASEEHEAVPEKEEIRGDKLREAVLPGMQTRSPK